MDKQYLYWIFISTIIAALFGNYIFNFSIGEQVVMAIALTGFAPEYYRQIEPIINPPAKATAKFIVKHILKKTPKEGAV